MRVWSTTGTDNSHREVLSDGLCTCEMERSKGHYGFAERGPKHCSSWSAEQGNLGAQEAVTPTHTHTPTSSHHHIPLMIGLSTELKSWSGSCKNSSTLGNKYPIPVSLRKVCEWKYAICEGVRV